MGTIAVHEFVSLDGVFENPSWTMQYGFDPSMGERIGRIMGACQAILLGRQTYQEFAPAWSGRTGEQDPGAPFMNESPKYVVSGTLADAGWQNSTVIGPYDPRAIQAVKDRVEGGIYVSGSGTLVRAMLADGLVDELHLFIYPVVLGAGQRLFADGGPQLDFTVSGTDAYENGVTHVSLAPKL